MGDLIDEPVVEPKGAMLRRSTVAYLDTRGGRTRHFPVGVCALEQIRQEARTRIVKWFGLLFPPCCGLRSTHLLTTDPPRVSEPPPSHLTRCLPTYTQHGAVSSVDLDTHAEAPLDAASTLTTGGHTSEPKPSVQALVHMEADGRIGATEAAVHALVMTHNLTLRERRLRVSFLSGERHVEK